jgi:hypothetical protein
VKKPLIGLLGFLLLSGCQATDPLSGENDPKHRQWSLEFTAPIYMTGWVEASLVEDINGRLLDHGSGGVIGTGSIDYGVASELARGWPRALGGGGGASLVQTCRSEFLYAGSPWWSRKHTAPGWTYPKSPGKSCTHQHTVVARKNLSGKLAIWPQCTSVWLRGGLCRSG